MELLQYIYFAIYVIKFIYRINQYIINHKLLSNHNHSYIFFILIKNSFYLFYFKRNKYNNFYYIHSYKIFYYINKYII